MVRTRSRSWVGTATDIRFLRERPKVVLRLPLNSLPDGAALERRQAMPLPSADKSGRQAQVPHLLRSIRSMQDASCIAFASSFSCCWRSPYADNARLPVFRWESALM